ncbi:MAG: hypothetical protein ACFFD3_13720 [Candidatus Thorarchaeota archaeon]
MENGSKQSLLISLLFLILVFIFPFVVTAGVASNDELYIMLESFVYYIAISNTFYGSVIPLQTLLTLSFAHLYQIPRFLVAILAYYHFNGRIALKYMMLIGFILEITTALPYVIAGLLAPPLIAFPLPLLSLGILVISKIRIKN